MREHSGVRSTMGIDKAMLHALISWLGLVLVGQCHSITARDQLKRMDDATSVPIPMSTDGWRPLIPATNWPKNTKVSVRGGYSQENVGHPVLSKLQAHLEAAEKKLQQKLEVYSPAPPSILGSFSVFGHATVKARDPNKNKNKKSPVNENGFQSSESRLVYSSHLVPPPFQHVQHTNLLRLPEHYQHRPDQLSEQQQQQQYFLQSPLHQAQYNFTNTLLIPPAQNADNFYSTPQITSYQSQKFGDFLNGPSVLSFPQQIHHHQYHTQTYNDKNPGTQVNTEYNFPSKLHQTLSFPSSTNIEFLPQGKLPGNNRDIPVRDDKDNYSDVENASGLEFTKTSQQSKHHTNYNQAQQQSYESEEHSLRNNEHRRPHNGGVILTPSPESAEVEDVSSIVQTASNNGEIIRGQTYNENFQYSTPASVSELYVPHQQSTTDKHLSSALGFTLGVSPSQQDTGSPAIDNPYITSQSSGERGRITRPYFKEEFHSGNLPQGNKKQRYPHNQPQRSPPTATEVPEVVVGEGEEEEGDQFLPTLSPAEEPSIIENQNEVHLHESRKPPVFQTQAEQFSDESQEGETGEQVTPQFEKPRPYQSRRPTNTRNRYPVTAADEEVLSPHRQTETRHKTRRPVHEIDPQDVDVTVQDNNHKSRPRRPNTNKKPIPVQEEVDEEQLPPEYEPTPKYRRPQYHRRRPSNGNNNNNNNNNNHYTQNNDGSDIRPHYSRRPGTRIRQRPSTAIEDDYTRDDVIQNQQHRYNGHNRPYRRRKPTSTAPPPQYIDVTAGSMNSGPSGEDDIFSSQYGTTASEDETQETAPATESPYTTSSTTTIRPRRGNPYNRHRGKDKYVRQPPTPRTTTVSPHTTTQNLVENAQVDDDIPETVVELIGSGNDLQNSVTVTQNYVDEAYTLPSSTTSTTTVPPTTTTESTTTPTTTTTTSTTTTTTTTTTTELPATTEIAAASTSTVTRLRPRLRYGVNSTRPRFSVKDYRERLNRISPTSAGNHKYPEEAYELSKTKPDGDTSASNTRVRYPARIRGSYQYKKPEEEEVEEEEKSPSHTTTESTRSRYRPKESRYGSSRYRSTSTSTTPHPEVTDSTEKTKTNTGRYRSGTGKYYSRYRSTTEMPSVTHEADGSSTTPRLPVRPKGVFSAARRPYPLRTRNKEVNSADNHISDGKKDDSDNAETSVQPQIIPQETTTTTTTTTSVPEVTHVINYGLPSYLNTEMSSLLNSEFSPSKLSENDVIPATMTEKVDSTIEPQDISDNHEDVLYTILNTTPVNKEDMSDRVSITTPQPEEETLSPSQRVADLTSSASLGGFFKTAVSATNIDARRITMATEDPILPIEAFFPLRGNKKFERSR